MILYNTLYNYIINKSFHTNFNNSTLHFTLLYPFANNIYINNCK